MSLESGRGAAARIWQPWQYAALAVALLVCGASATPLLRELRSDSYPLSTYPMFARARGRPIMHQVLGVERGGRRRRLAPELFGTGELLQAKTLIRAAVSRGRKSSLRLCKNVAKRIAKDAALAQITEVYVLTVRHDPIAYLLAAEGERQPLSQRRRARCTVRRVPK